MRQDHRGVSLIEILVAITILTLCAVPLFRSMILSAQMNAKSRRLLAATNAAEAVMEDLKADGMKKFIEKNAGSGQIADVEYIEEDGKKTGYRFSYPEYEMDDQKFCVKVEVQPYKNDDAENDYNTKEIADLHRMNLATDAIYTENVRYAEDDFVKAVAEDRFTMDQREQVLENLDTVYEYDIETEGDTQRVEQSVSYYYQEEALGSAHRARLYDSSMEDGSLYSLYVFFEAKQNTTITIRNLKDYPLDVYLVSQGGKDTGITVRLQGSEPMQHFGEEQDADFTKGIRLKTNFDGAGVFSYEYRGLKKNLTRQELERYFDLAPLDNKKPLCRLYNVTVEVFHEEESITYLTGTVVR